MKKTPEIDFVKRVRLIKNAGIDGINTLNANLVNDTIEELPQRIKKALGIFEKYETNPHNMLFFVMYDIEDNKVRTQISKYLERKGCIRIQKSIFLAEKPRKVYNEIQETLKEVNECYDNHDSICLVPISTDQLRAMKIIGQNIDLDFITGNTNTMFF
jgi:CRISPR-associated endonuclease Cas2